ncbi:hypothetical protein Anapl_03257 [Anas platyrhynchos]|uniref:Uncharacterized protein n=1 Tax=Anas platyrhynchos TaxID=8839 RepID=R0LWC9_ANAPL|nr:hypothetical protein Anapl_03257 [Anas platyrhynchos]
MLAFGCGNACACCAWVMTMITTSVSSRCSGMIIFFHKRHLLKYQWFPVTSSFWILPGCHKLQAVQLSIPSYAQASAHPRAAAAKGVHGLAAEGLIGDQHHPKSASPALSESQVISTQGSQDTSILTLLPCLTLILQYKRSSTLWGIVAFSSSSCEVQEIDWENPLEEAYIIAIHFDLCVKHLGYYFWTARQQLAFPMFLNDFLSHQELKKNITCYGRMSCNEEAKCRSVKLDEAHPLSGVQTEQFGLRQKGQAVAAWPSTELCVETEEHFPCYVCISDAWGKEVQQLPEAPVMLLYVVIWFVNDTLLCLDKGLVQELNKSPAARVDEQQQGPREMHAEQPALTWSYGQSHVPSWCTGRETAESEPWGFQPQGEQGNPWPSCAAGEDMRPTCTMRVPGALSRALLNCKNDLVGTGQRRKSWLGCEQLSQFEVQHTASQQRRIPGSTLLAGAEPSPSLLMLQLNQSQAALGPALRRERNLRQEKGWMGEGVKGHATSPGQPAACREAKWRARGGDAARQAAEGHKLLKFRSKRNNSSMARPQCWCPGGQHFPAGAAVGVFLLQGDVERRKRPWRTGCVVSPRGTTKESLTFTVVTLTKSVQNPSFEEDMQATQRSTTVAMYRRTQPHQHLFPCPVLLCGWPSLWERRLVNEAGDLYRRAVQADDGQEGHEGNQQWAKSTEGRYTRS